MRVYEIDVGLLDKRKLKARLLGKAKQSGPCLLWHGCRNEDGYGIMHITKLDSGIRQIIRVHQLSWLLYRGPIPKGMCVLHKCDTPNCINHRHLWIGSHRQNMEDMARKGRSFKGNKGLIGANHPSAVLDEKMVLRAREAIKTKCALKALSKLTGFKYGTLWKAARRPWGELP